MAILSLFILVGFYYVVYLTSVLYVEGNKKLPMYLYLISFVLYLIPFIFIGADYDARSSYYTVLSLALIAYAWMTISGFWTKPLRVKAEQLAQNPTKNILNDENNNIENLIVKITIAKYKARISLMVTIIITITMALKATPQLRSEMIDMIMVMALALFAVFIGYLVADLILWKKRKQFAFIAIKPLFVFGWLVLLEIVMAISGEIF
ncbi:DUF5080 family protein [Mammaliicoccus sp. Dog046]|uniref:DUF5080 family protein n=1 Tax=Mammaliicoccus sp. Dog046 TaxID=3034233 RepID=UPI002B264342|nr:DUF5080 family protein [Mammaliicoccus sp. Dog046]WQK85596.1 DUF5080 family protein [Mammaliicoccus sp. Dog046]